MWVILKCMIVEHAEQFSQSTTHSLFSATIVVINLFLSQL